MRQLMSGGLRDAVLDFSDFVAELRINAPHLLIEFHLALGHVLLDLHQVRARLHMHVGVLAHLALE